MSTLRLVASYTFHRLNGLPRRGHHAYIPSRSVETSPFNRGYCFITNHAVQTSTGENAVQSKLHVTMENNLQPPAPRPPKHTFPLWARWVLGSILSLFLPFCKKKWEKLQKIESEVENVAEVIETAAEVVEKVAEVAGKVSSEVADKLPDDGKLKNAVLLVERVSNEAAKDAQTTIDLIHKVEELKQEVSGGDHRRK
ncbi:uncharacterized protein LOC143848799 [Tasmannia lanceolata]|uniref:uncharacterized protein LOC143848799 n=1 Tax=Tasmannia lanceolata TaxID=3420 RepID=UPI004062AD0B